MGRITDGSLLKSYLGISQLFYTYVSLKGLNGLKKEHIRLGERGGRKH